MKKLIVFLGRNLVREIGGILSEAREMFPNLPTTVVAANGDQLLNDPEFVAFLRERDVVCDPAVADWAVMAGQAYCMPVKDFRAEKDVSYVLVANGGMTNQLVPVLGRLLASGANVEVFDLQRDGKRQLWPE
jgi:hypothetical protein